MSNKNLFSSYFYFTINRIKCQVEEVVHRKKELEDPGGFETLGFKIDWQSMELHMTRHMRITYVDLSILIIRIILLNI